MPQSGSGLLVCRAGIERQRRERLTRAVREPAAAVRTIQERQPCLTRERRHLRPWRGSECHALHQRRQGRERRRIDQCERRSTVGVLAVPPPCQQRSYGEQGDDGHSDDRPPEGLRHE
jgi:hypothetical protein